MTGLPTVVVSVDDGTGTFPTNITTKTRLPEGLTWTRGRGDELSTTSPGTASFTWDNTDGTLTPFGVSGLSCDQGVRIKVNGANRWTGRLSSVPVAWPTGGQEFAVIGATATDAGAALARVTVDGAADEESTVDPGLVAYYPMQEEADATFTRDASGNNRAPLTLVPGSTGSSSFDVGLHVATSAVGLLDGATGWKQAGGASSSPTLLSTLQATTDAPTLTAGIRITFAYQGTMFGAVSTDAIIFRPLDGVHASAVIATDSFGSILTNFAGGALLGADLLADNLPHVVTYQGNASGQSLWVDGVMVDSDAGAFSAAPWTGGYTVQVGSAALTAGFPYQIFSRISIGNTTLSSGRIATLHSAILNDCLNETPSARLTRLLSYVDGVSIGTVDTSGDTKLGLAAQAGKNISDLINDVTTADLGQAFIDKNGTLSSISGATTAGLTSPVTLDANWFAEDTQFIVDMFGVVNSATGKSSYTQNPVAASDPTSIASHGLYPTDFEWDVSTDAQALDRTNWMVASYSEPSPRVGSLTLDMMTLGSTNLTNALTLDLGSWLQITGLPSQTPGGTTADFIIEGITETISMTEWTLTMNVASRDVVGAWILGDSTWSVLGSTTKLYV